MKKDTTGYILKCPQCGKIVESCFRAVICTGCGNVAVVPPLTDGAFEKAAEGDEVKVTKPEKKPVENTQGRAPENGGEAF